LVIICHTNHPDGTAHGGTAVLKKDTITYYEELKYLEEAMKSTSLRVKGPIHDITVAAVYFPPQEKLKKEQFETFFQILESKFVAGGDYNSKHILWGSRLTTTKVRELP